MELKCYLILPVCVLLLQSFRTATSTNVLIIGAGPSGMAAACRLLENGVNNLTILEAQSRIGGRIHTIEFGDSVVDMGAHWVHGEKGNVVSEMAQALNMLDNTVMEVADMTFASSSQYGISSNTSTKFLGVLMDLVETSNEFLKSYNGSLGGYAIKGFYGNVSANGLSTEELFYASPFLDWFDKFQNTVDGSDSWFYTSGRGMTVYREAEGNQAQAWKTGGYANVFDILTKKVPDPANELPINNKILFNKEVVNIEWDNVEGNKVKVTCLDGSNFFADHVIVTTSLGVLKERYESLFTPSLPSKKVTAITGLSIDTVDKIYLRFPHQWWPNSTTGFSFIWTDEDIYNFNKEHNIKRGNHWLMGVVGFYPVDLNPNVLCGWLTGSSARVMESLPLTEVTSDSMELLTRFLGSRFEIPQPIETLRTTWWSNPYTRGSYSFRSVDTEAVGTEAAHLAEPLTNSQGKQTVLFAGEATHDYFYSTVHGAVESGWREADRVLEILRLAPSKK